MEENNFVISENDEIMLNLDDNINVFLKVRKPAMEDKVYYELDENKNIFTLYDQLKVHLENQNYMKWIKYLQTLMKIHIFMKKYVEIV